MYLHDNVRVMCLCSQELLKQIDDLEVSGEHKGGGASGGGGGVDANLRENVSLFRLSTDAVVKVKCANVLTMRIH